MIAEGYKDTEIGVIPIEWDVVELKDIVKKLQSGGTPLSTNSDFYDGDIPFVKIDDITRSKKYLRNTKVTITQQGLDSSSAWLVPINSILYSMYASIGFLSINKIEVATNQAIMNIIPDNSKITLEFLYQYLMDLKGKIDKFIDQTTQKNLNAQKIKKFKIPLPPLKEQEKIADILSTADDKIDAIASQIEKTETLKKGLLQKLLSEGMGHSEFKDSELGKIPESWEVVEFGKHLDVKSGFGFKASDYSQKGIPLVKIDNVSYGNIIWENTTYLPTNFTEKYQKLVLSKDDILLALNRPITQNKLKMAILKEKDAPSILYQRVGKILFDKTYFYKFVYYMLYRYVYDFVLHHSVGTDQPFINITKIRKLFIPLPPLEEQKQIADILSIADEKLEVLRAKKEKYETLKKGLLQKLLSGEVRV